MRTSFAAFAPATGLPVAVAALVGGVGGTVSLLVHELGHVTAARRLAGIRSGSISLVWFAAAARLDGRYANGREQARVAIAGPRASLLLALMLVVYCFVPLPGVVESMLFALALFNVLLAVLNLVPAYPLDGYKVVVGLLWSLFGSETRARRLIRRIGLGWAAVELSATSVLLLERPSIGVAAAVTAASFLAQKRFARRRAARR